MKESISAGILCGGMATRMGGIDKGLQTIQIEGSGLQPMVEHVINQFETLTDKILISANRNLDRYRQYSEAVYPDLIGGALGPLSGLHTLLSHCETSQLIVSPCDTPFVNQMFIQRMIEASRSHGSHRICVASIEQRLEPLHLIVPVSVTYSLDQSLQQRKLSVQKWLRAHDPVVVDFSKEASVFRNINTPADLKQHSSSV